MEILKLTDFAEGVEADAFVVLSVREKALTSGGKP